MRFQFLYFGKLHNGTADIAETLCSEIGRGDVFYIASEIDARVLFRVTVSRYFVVSTSR
jgi:hypothetical protein